jgi:hypothetical protein
MTKRQGGARCANSEGIWHRAAMIRYLTSFILIWTSTTAIEDQKIAETAGRRSAQDEVRIDNMTEVVREGTFTGIRRGPETRRDRGIHPDKEEFMHRPMIGRESHHEMENVTNETVIMMETATKGTGNKTLVDLEMGISAMSDKSISQEAHPVRQAVNIRERGRSPATVAVTRVICQGIAQQPKIEMAVS